MPRLVATAKNRWCVRSLAGRSQASQTQLLMLSCLPSLSEADAALLTGDEGAGRLLKRFYRNGLFVDRLGTKTAIYHFHSLFQEFLAQEAVQRLEPELRSTLLERAAIIPSDQVVSITSIEAKSFGGDEGASVIRYNNQTYPHTVLSKWLGFDGADNIAAEAARPCVIVHGAKGTVAVEVDQVLESRELILQDVGRLARCIPGLAAGTVRADGTPMFLLDMPELERASYSSLIRTSSAAMRRRMQAQRIRVMVVDDALSVRRSMEQLLQDNGYSVALAVDGFDALEKIENEPPAILVTDLEMPNLNGLELTRRLRSMPQWDALPIVMITSRATDKHRDMANEAGVDLYLSKPYVDIDFLAHLRRLTAESKVEMA